MNILIGCECSGVVRKAFRDAGHNAWSNDILPAMDNSIYHLQCDIRDVLDLGWDMLIAFPPCTYLTVTANRWFTPKYVTPERLLEREKAIQFFMELVNAPINHIAVENPVGIMSTVYRKPDQIIQPYNFGHVESKRTCLWLKNLEELIGTTDNSHLVEYTPLPRGRRIAKWISDAKSKPNYRYIRSETFQGIADAMVRHWSNIKEVNNES